jgi:hypothetical protein
MKITDKVLIMSLLTLIGSTYILCGQTEKNEQRIKIIVTDDGNRNVVLDTLITGKPASDSIVLRDSTIIKVAHGPLKRKIAVCEELAGQTASVDEKQAEKTKYVIKRNGITITLEGSDYEKIRILKDEIEHTLNTNEEFKKERSE